MLVKQEQLNPSEVELHIEIEAEQVNQAVDRSYVDLGKVVNIPGFRKGKAPKEILERFLDEEKVKDRAADKLLKKAYLEALEESKLEPYAAADVEVVKFEIGEPLVFTAKVPLPPKVELGPYTGIEVERHAQQITEQDIERDLNTLLERHAQYPEITDRPARQGDVVRIETRAENESEEEAKRNVVQIGDNLPDFDSGLTGMSPGEEKVISVSYPEDYASEELRGKTVPINLKLHEIHEKQLPELTDEWVKTSFGGKQEEGAEPSPDAIDTVEKLRETIKTEMEKAAQSAADGEARNAIVHKIIEGSKVDFPQVMVDEIVKEHLEEMIENLKKRKLTLEDYLKYKEISFEDLRSQYEEEAKQELRSMLVLREITDKEDIKVEEDDIRAEMETMAGENGVPVETIRAYVDKTNAMPSVRNRILTKKLMDFLVHASNIKNVGS
ncbi:MAG: trigger factor [Armatimonadetes bacterium]|nr:trigger factor [Armatimonadota bacterium]